MTAFGRAELTFQELQDELRFRVDRENGWFMLCAFPGLSFAALLVAFAVPDRGAAFGIAITAGTCLLVSVIMAAAALKHSIRTTTLSVTNRAFEARGAGLGWFPAFGESEVAVPVPEITSFGYSPSTEDEPSGFEVRCGFWKCVILLPGLSLEQTNSVTDAILRKFPEIGAKIRRRT